MTSTAPPAPSPVATVVPRSARVAYHAMRSLLLFFGVFGAVAASYFGFVLDPADGGIGNGFDLFVTLWKLGISVVFVLAAVGPGLDRDQRVSLARWAMAAQLVFDAIKILYYHETAAWVFLAIDCVLLTLVLLAARTTRSQA